MFDIVGTTVKKRLASSGPATETTHRQSATHVPFGLDHFGFAACAFAHLACSNNCCSQTINKSPASLTTSTDFHMARSICASITIVINIMFVVLSNTIKQQPQVFFGNSYVCADMRPYCGPYCGPYLCTKATSICRAAWQKQKHTHATPLLSFMRRRIP